MKRIVFGVLVSCGLVLAGAALADRTDTWSAASLEIVGVDLRKLPDGGCVVTAVGVFTKQDGGVSVEQSRPTEVSGANRTTCLDVMNTKAPILFKADREL